MVHLRELQTLLDRIYGERDRKRGPERTLLWLVSEVGEVSEVLIKGKGSGSSYEVELADALAWLLSFANVVGIDIEGVFLKRYGSGCPRCGSIPCTCPER
jgi:NTP pyrophosphatase (non-canonical NTP hydrolase)